MTSPLGEAGIRGPTVPETQIAKNVIPTTPMSLSCETFETDDTLMSTLPHDAAGQ